jgi:conjugative relaxase-like TrwC/TraI family protein
MLTLSPVNNIEYYKNSEKEDYYINADSIGLWHGGFKKRFGLGENVLPHEYDNVMSLKYPKTGINIFKKEQNIKLNAIDLTFSMPKSASLFWAFGGKTTKKKIESAQIAAVKTTMNYLEKNIARIRRGKNGVIKEEANGTLSSIVAHYLSRELEPQLHSHVLLYNFTTNKLGGFMGLDIRNLYFNQKVLGALYRSQLSFELNKFGFECEKDGDSFRLKSIKKTWEAIFSTRSNQIRASLNQLGCGAKSASPIGDKVALMTRKRKQTADFSELTERWKNKIKESYLSKIVILKNNVKYISKIMEVDVFTRLTENKSTFTKQQLEYEILSDSICGNKNLIELKQELTSYFKDKELVKLKDSEYQSIYTTKRILRLEKELISLAKELHSKFQHRLDKDTLSKAVKKFEKIAGFSPTQEQHNALIFACSGSDFSCVQGSAGAGKSTIMLALRLAYELNGNEVIGASIVKKAAENLEAESGIKSFTIDKLISEFEKGKNLLFNKSALVIDEAGQVSTTKLTKLLIMAKEASTKIVLTGDDKQLDAIQYGGALSYLSQKFGVFRVEKIQRQSSKREIGIVSNFRDGHMVKAFTKLYENGHLNFADSAENRAKNLVESTIKFIERSPNKDFLILAQRWAEVDIISKEIREYFIRTNKISGEIYTRKCIVSNHECSLPFQIGDEIRFTKNNYILKVSNGTNGRIISLKEDNQRLIFSIELNNKRIVRFCENDYKNEDGRLYLCHAYATTIYSSQGLTVDGDTFISWSTSMDRANNYVAGSRHKDNSHWFFNEAELKAIEINKEESLINVISKQANKEKRSSLATYLLEEKSNIVESVKSKMSSSLNSHI